MGLTIGSSSDDTAFTLKNGAHDTRFRWVRFRGRGEVLWDICDYTDHWNDDVRRDVANAHDITWTDCEFEYTGDSDGTTFNIWWDARRGGGNLYNLTWNRCAFGVKNADGDFGSGRMGMLIQPSPPEQAEDGPRPESSDYPALRLRVEPGHTWFRAGRDRRLEGLRLPHLGLVVRRPRLVHERRHLRLRACLGHGHLQAHHPGRRDPCDEGRRTRPGDDQARRPARRVDGG